MMRRRRIGIVMVSLLPAILLTLRVVCVSANKAYLAVSEPITWTGIRSFSASPNHKVIAFATTDGRLYTFNLSTRKANRLLIGCGEDQLDPSFSRDGRFLAFVARWNSRDRFRHVFIADLMSDKRPTQITSAGDDSVPSFSSDGKSLVFERIIPYYRFLGPCITSPFSVDIRSGIETRLTTQTYACTSRPGCVDVSTPYFTNHDSVVSYYGSAWNANMRDQTNSSGLFQIALRHTNRPIPTAPSMVNTGPLRGTIEDAVPFSDGAGFALSCGSPVAVNGGLWLFNLQTGSGIKIKSVPSNLTYHSPNLVVSDTLYVLAETGTEPSGAPINSLWVCHVSDSKPAEEIISLQDLTQLN